MQRGRRLVGVAGSVAAALGAAVTLVVFRPDLAQLRRAVDDPHRWLDVTGVDQAAAVVAGLGLRLLALRVAAGFIAALVGLVPGSVGAVADRLSGLLLPAILRRAVAAAAGVGVMLAPVAAGAHEIGSPGRVQYGSATAVPPGHSIPAPAWPTGAAPSPSSASGTGTPSAARPALRDPALRDPALRDPALRPPTSRHRMCRRHRPAGRLSRPDPAARPARTPWLSRPATRSG